MNIEKNTNVKYDWQEGLSFIVTLEKGQKVEVYANCQDSELNNWFIRDYSWSGSFDSKEDCFGWLENNGWKLETDWFKVSEKILEETGIITSVSELKQLKITFPYSEWISEERISSDNLGVNPKNKLGVYLVPFRLGSYGKYEGISFVESQEVKHNLVWGTTKNRNDPRPFANPTLHLTKEIIESLF